MKKSKNYDSFSMSVTNSLYSVYSSLLCSVLQKIVKLEKLTFYSLRISRKKVDTQNASFE